MLKIKELFIKHKKLIIIAFILLICSIAIAFGVYAQITRKGAITTTTNNNGKHSIDYDKLKNNFNSIFTNSINVGETNTSNPLVKSLAQ